MDVLDCLGCALFCLFSRIKIQKSFSKYLEIAKKVLSLQSVSQKSGVLVGWFLLVTFDKKRSLKDLHDTKL
jgi:hypothetical protein